MKRNSPEPETEPFAPFLADHAVHIYRGGLSRTARALAAGRLRLGFIGGSITEFNYKTWPEGVIRWFGTAFPNVRLHVENAAIGATGSQLGVFRAQRDLLDRGCDLVFIEYAVNDMGIEPESRRRTQEGLVRKLLAEQRDLVFCYPYCSGFHEDMAAGRVPRSIQDLDEVAAHYGAGSVWMGVHTLNEVRAGLMRWEEWLPDGAHTGEHGSWSYAESVVAFLKRELIEKPSASVIPFGAQLPAPLDPANWESATTLPFDQIRLKGPWVIRRSVHWWSDEALETAAIGARMEFDFEGRAVCLGFNFGKTSSEFRYRVDDSEWVTTTRERPWWCPETGWLRIHPLSESLPPGRHHVEIEVIHGNRPECTGTNFRLALIGVVT